MDLKDELEAAVTRGKIDRLRESHARAAARPCENPSVRAHTLRSLKRLIHQMTEELVRYECRMGRQARDILAGTLASDPIRFARNLPAFTGEPFMIPDFEKNGYLPPGLHHATLDEVEQRFGRGSELRRVQMESLRWLIDLARRAGIERIALNGSFVTDIDEPNDVDCLLLTGQGFPTDVEAEAEIMDGLPFLEIDLVDPEEWVYMVEVTFGTDRESIPKGLVEVISWI